MRGFWTAVGWLALLALVLAAPGAIGWWVGDHFWHRGTEGAFTPYLVVLFLWAILSDDRILSVVLNGILAFAAAVPVIYLLILGTELIMMAGGLVDYTGHAFFVRSLLAALSGTAVGVLLNVLGTLKRASGKRVSESELEDAFLYGLSVRVPLAFLVATLTIVPERPVARVVLGALWGVVGAAAALVHSAVVEESSWQNIVFFEIILGAGLIVGVLVGLTDRPVLVATVQLVPAAIVGCLVTFGVAVLVGVGWRAVRRG